MSDSTSLYLNLMKKTLSYKLWPEPGIPLETSNIFRPVFKQSIIETIVRILNYFNLQILESTPDKKRADGNFWPLYADTMIGMKRLDNLEFCITEVLKNNIPGDFIEAGVWRGGAAIFMRAILAAYNITDRRVLVADSFQGLPRPNVDKYAWDKDDIHYKLKFLAVSQAEVAANFEKYGLLDEQVVFLPGWFKDTLPNIPSSQLALIRLDGDMYESTLDSLTNLYPKLSPNGFCIIDDYALTGCKAAVDEYRDKYNIQSPLVKIDWTGIFWQK